MERLQGRIRDYAWGSRVAIPGLFGLPRADKRVAEVWFGAHPDDPARVINDPHGMLFDLQELYPESAGVLPLHVRQAEKTEETLRDFIAANPAEALGELVAQRQGNELPYLLKLIAPREPLSLQVHPTLKQAEEGFAAEEAAGIPRTSPERNYKDRNHKPELAYALSHFEALAGFRTVRRILEVIGGLDTPLTDSLVRRLNSDGVRGAFRFLLSEGTRPDAEAVREVVEACKARDPEESPSARADHTVVILGKKHPDNPGVVASLFLNPVTLYPGEALFIPCGTVHAYLSGTAVEIMASSDNVLRAGLTEKHVDVSELLKIVRAEAAPPVRIAPEKVSRAVSTFYAPVDDFELSVIRLRDATQWVRVRTLGPRTVICLEGAAQLHTKDDELHINAGQAVFVPASEGRLTMRGFGQLVLAGVP